MIETNRSYLQVLIPTERLIKQVHSIHYYERLKNRSFQYTPYRLPLETVRN